MADQDASLDIVIRTRADLEGAQAAETQLDRDIVKARELGGEYAAQEEQARGARTARAEGKDDNAPDSGDQMSEPPPDNAGENETTPKVQQTPDATKTVQASDEPAAEVRGLNQPGQQQLMRESSGELEPEPESLQAPENEPPDREQLSHQLMLPDAGEIAAQTQAVEAAGESLRAALEENGRMTVEMLNRTVELIEQQNRALTDMGRRLEQLGSRIRSAQNA